MKKKILLIITIFVLAFLFGNGIAGIIDECVNVSFNGNKLNTMNWGLSFQNEGSTPVGNSSAEELRQYNAFYVGNEDDKKYISRLMWDMRMEILKNIRCIKET